MVRGKEPGCRGSAARGTEAGGLAGQPTSLPACPVSPVPVPVPVPTPMLMCLRGTDTCPPTVSRYGTDACGDGTLQVVTPNRIACDTQV